MPIKKRTRIKRVLAAHPTATCVYMDPLGNVFLPENLPEALSLWGVDASKLHCIRRKTLPTKENEPAT